MPYVVTIGTLLVWRDGQQHLQPVCNPAGTGALSDGGGAGQASSLDMVLSSIHR